MKKAILIGTTFGIEKELAKILAENNYIVGITESQTELIENLKKEKPDSFLCKSFDVTNIKATIENIEALIAELGGLDLLVIGSGIRDVNHKWDFRNENKATNLSILGFIAICDWTFNYFEKQKHGHLTTITPIAGLYDRSLTATYSAKSFQIKYIERLRLKAKETMLPIYITDIRQGFVDVTMTEGVGSFWATNAHKAASQIVQAIVAKKEIAYVPKRWKLVALILKCMSYEYLTV